MLHRPPPVLPLSGGGTRTSHRGLFCRHRVAQRSVDIANAIALPFRDPRATPRFNLQRSSRRRTPTEAVYPIPRACGTGTAASSLTHRRAPIGNTNPLFAMTPAARIAVVTGASRGIGRAAALALAETGAHVIAVARTVGALEELDDEIKARGGAATLVPLDLKDYAGIDRLGAAIFSRWGRLDMLLGNAGLLGAITPLAHLEPRVWDDVM